MSNQKYQKILFVGARGTWDKMPFEVLGSGLVDYRVNVVGDPEDSMIIGQTYPATEYYCLANNGQTWYFAVSDEELYYCRELNMDEIVKLKKDIGMESQSLSQSTSEFLRNPKWIRNWQLDEGGVGKLQSATGRANRDLRNFADFEYYDFDYFGKSYSVDIFPNLNGEMVEEEWFETKFVPQKELTKIFADSLRLGNPNFEKILKLSKLWQKIMILSLILAVLVIVLGSFISSQKSTVWSEIKEFNSSQKEIVFENIPISQINQINTLSTSVSLPSSRGLTLSFSFFENGSLLSTSSQEYTNTGQSVSNSVQTNTFFPKNIQNYKLIVKIQDYGVLGQTNDCFVNSAPNPLPNSTQSLLNSQSLNSAFSENSSFGQNDENLGSENYQNSEISQNSTSLSSSCVLEIPKIDLTVQIIKGGIWWPVWIFGSIICVCIGIIASSIKQNLENQIWKL